MPTRFVLDTREKHLQYVFKTSGVPFETKQLDLGDILIYYSKGSLDNSPEVTSTAQRLLEGKLEESSEIKSEEKKKEPIHVIVIERKTFTDLAASMTDKRYHEQKARYLQLPKGTCWYILENNDPKFETLNRKQFLGMYMNTMIRDRLSVFLSQSLEETCELIVRAAQSLEEFGLEYHTSNESASVVTQIKKKHLPVYIQQLCCFTGISKSKADSIAAVYGNLFALTEALRNGTFKVKGVGKVLIGNMKEGLMMTDKPVISFE